MIFRSFFVVLILEILTIVSSEIEFPSPEERCAEDTSLTYVCYSCRQLYDCSAPTTTITDCDGDTICDITFADGYCLPPVMIPDTCKCESTGCMQDPFNANTILDCTAGDDYPDAIITCPVDHTANPETCDCLSEECPECGFISADISDICSQKFIFCGNDPSTKDGILLECEAQHCYDEVTCQCNEFTCPDCGLAIDNTVNDGSICFCGGADLVCGLKCVDGEQFYSDTCVCESIRTTSAEVLKQLQYHKKSKM